MHSGITETSFTNVSIPFNLLFKFFCTVRFEHQRKQHTIWSSWWGFSLKLKLLDWEFLEPEKCVTRIISIVCRFSLPAWRSPPPSWLVTPTAPWFPPTPLPSPLPRLPSTTLAAPSTPLLALLMLLLSMLPDPWSAMPCIAPASLLSPLMLLPPGRHIWLLMPALRETR